ncbi:MAG: response regulator transcription factor [Ignavibacteria bacterium]|nr:response regulator transcription factor [Ignavibacteria bacterium]
MNILLIEDEKKISEFIRKGLKEQSYNVDAAFDGVKGHNLATNNDYDLIILDILLPKQNGFSVCNKLREDGIKTPILMLTSMGQTEDKVRGLNMGADDYLTKPFKFEELLARIRSISRRGNVNKNIIYQIDDLQLDVSEHLVRRNNTQINLTAKEFALLEYLLKNKKRVMSRTQISENVWGIDFDRGSNVVDTYIKFLRQKIEKGFSKPLIHTIIGVGYVLREEK